MSKPEEIRYPEKIKVDWTKTHIAMTAISFAIWPAYLYFGNDFSCQKILSITGLFCNSFGAVIATLKPPFSGFFYDGGDLQIDSEKLAYKYFRCGMAIVAFGLVLQAIKEFV